jgi:SAM-dependent methyltransferase
VLEHLDEDQTFLREVRRVLRPGGRALVTVPTGDQSLLANRVKQWIGMKPEVYGHTRMGYTLAQLRDAVRQSGLSPVRGSGYSRFFTEMLELAINYSYVAVLSRKQRNAQPGRIAPTSSGELKSHGAAYRVYSLAYPVFRLVSKLDRFLPARSSYAVIVEAVARQRTVQ